MGGLPFRVGLFFSILRLSLRRRQPLASQSRIPVEREARIRVSKVGQPACGWAYFAYPALVKTVYYAKDNITFSFNVGNF
mgnify:CR=1 FL=1